MNRIIIVLNRFAFAAVLALAWAAAAMAQAPAANYDEAKVPAYALPPLTTAGDGTPVRTAADWEKRREEIRSLLETRMFGRAPVWATR